MRSILTFTGRLHPLLVHLPIGILLIALFLLYLSRREKFTALRPAIAPVLLVGVFSAFASCLTGLMLSSSGEYDNDTVNLHMWMGIGTALVSAVLYSQVKRGKGGPSRKWTAMGLLGLIFMTGHLGGSLTHGGDYLSSAFSMQAAGGLVRKPIPDVQAALAYADIVEPVLAGKCYGCHGADKQKGKLRMDKQDLLMKGGKGGAVIAAGKPAESEIVKRIALPADDEHHMAPKEKPQLSSSEVALLSWWIENGASFTKKVKELPQTAAIKGMLSALQGGGAGDVTVDSDIPEEPVAAADEKALDLLRKRGAVVVPVAQNSHYIEVNFMGDSTIRGADLELLKPLQRQLVSLKLGGTSTGDSAMAVIVSCGALVRLQLEHTPITDKGIALLASLPRLKYINLVGTGVTAAGVEKLKGIKSLKTVYLYQTGVDKRQWAVLQAAMKGVRLDSGGYVVPTLMSDTQVVKPMPVKP